MITKKRLQRKIWVIKAGSQMVIEGGPLLIRDWMRQAHWLQEQGIDVLWVTSGAIATAKLKSEFSPTQNLSLPQKQAFSAMGQPIVHSLYQIGIESIGGRAAQVLLTADDLKFKQRKKNLIATLKCLLSWRVLPVLNENDAISTQEIQFGDNDQLAARLAVAIKAERLILLTDVEGLYDGDPNSKNGGARPKLIEHVPQVNPRVLGLARPSKKSKVGKGGMLSKLLAGSTCNQHRINTYLMKGDRPKSLVDLYKGNFTGTLIGSQK